MTLKHMLAGFGAFDQSSLTPVEREVVAMTVAFEMAYHYCMAMRSTEHAALRGAVRGAP
ncbi:MAG: hypothetical protein ABIY52_09855 [Gemmatimonadaceae bacterium]